MRRTKKILIVAGVSALVVAIIVVVSVGVTTGFKSSGKAQVGVQFRNLETTNKRDVNDPTSPTYFGMKFISVYLAEDVDNVTYNNIGQTEMIYINPQCENDISNCAIENAKHIITDFFDFSLPTDQVNAILNSQKLPVSPGKYHYIRLEFCKYTSGINIKFQAGNMTEPYSYGQPSCAVTSDRKEPPLEVKAGDEVYVQIDYNLNGTVWVNPYGNGGQSCSDTIPSYCFNLPTFVPSAIVSSPNPQ